MTIIGVEFALSAHTDLLESAGVLRDEKRICGRKPFPRGPDYQALVIDDFVSLSVRPVGKASDPSNAFDDLQRADAAYRREGVLGSPEKDVQESSRFKAVGAELNSSHRARSVGCVTVGAPLQKRAAMTVLSLRAAQLPVITPSFASKLAGNWTSIFMFRRCISCVLGEIYKFGSPSMPAGKDVYHLPRSTAQELVLASIFSFLAISDVTARFVDRVFTSDASMTKGAFCSRAISPEIAQVLWLGGDKKGTYTKLDGHYRELSKSLGLDIPDELEQAHDGEFETSGSIPGALDFSFDFLEVCAGVGSVSKELAALGYKVCTPIELSDSVHFDVTNLKLVNWICDMIRFGRLRSLMVEPVCTTFSAAAHPSLRSYTNPRGHDPCNPKTLVGNQIAFHCLFLCWYASLWGCLSLCEQPRLSKMCWLSIWRFLVQKKGFVEAIIASCQFGSPHRKEFRMLTRGLDADALQVRCPGGHEHLRVEGAYTKASAIYTPALAKHLARSFANALRRKQHVQSYDFQVSGLESVVANDLLCTGVWTVEKAWEWQSPSHINVLESHAYIGILRSQLLAGGDCRFTALLDSRVAKGAHAKGRSTSKALCPSLKRGAALQLAGGLYPSLGFAHQIEYG